MNDLHDDLRDDQRDDLERRLRASLQQRAEDVRPTPALYERVQRDIARTDRGPLWLGAVGLAFALAVTAVVVPDLLDRDRGLDIADTPPSDESRPPEESGAFVPGPVDPALGRALSDAGLAYVDADGVHVGAVLAPLDGSMADVASMTVRSGSDERDVVAAVGDVDGDLWLVDLFDESPSPTRPADLADLRIAANGGGFAFTPDGSAVAWIEGTELRVLTLRSEGEAVRSLPLAGEAPGDLVIQDWIEVADAQEIVAMSPTSGLWSIPMEVASAAATDVIGPVTPVPGAGVALAGVRLPNLSVARVRSDTDSSLSVLTTLDQSGQETVSGTLRSSLTDVAVERTGDVVVVEGGGTGVLATAVADGTMRITRTFSDLGLLAIAPLDVPASALEGDAVDLVTGEPSLLDDPEPEPSDRGSASDAEAASEDGLADDQPLDNDDASVDLATDLPVVAADGAVLYVIDSDGSEQSFDFYDQPAEAQISDLAIRPGSRRDDLTAAVVSSAEGETSIRVARFVDGERQFPPLVAAVAQGDVTGLVWDPAGAVIAWSDDAGLSVVRLSEDSSAAGEPRTLSTLVLPVTDWIWTEVDGDATRGVIRLGDVGPGGIAYDVVQDGTDLTFDEQRSDEDGVGIDAGLDTFGPDSPSWRFTVEGDVVSATLVDPDGSRRVVAEVAVTQPPVGYATGGGVAVVETDPTTDDGVQRITADGRVEEISVFTGGYDVLD